MNQELLKDGELKVQTLGRGFAWLDTVEVIEKRQRDEGGMYGRYCLTQWVYK